MPEGTKKNPLDEATEKLRAFLEANASAQLIQVEVPEKYLAVKSPWGDDTIQIRLPADVDPLANALSNVYLPEKFTALWHKDTQRFEVIFTAYPLTGPYKELVDRKFRFDHDGTSYSCYYGPSSDRLMVIAEHFVPIGFGNSFFRNLYSFRNYVLAEKGIEGFEKIPDGKPVSFWVEGIPDWDEGRVLDLVNHLNFYMAYHDTRSPQIMINYSSEISVSPQTRFPFEKFPAIIRAKRIPDTLINFWSASLVGDSARRFLYSYQVVEYAAHFFMDETTKRQLRKCLEAPNALDDLDGLSERMISVLSPAVNQRDHVRIAALLRAVLDPDLLWRELSNNLAAFTGVTTFDGDLEVPPVIEQGMDQKAFADRKKGVDKFAGAAKEIRNGLSHGKEEHMKGVITPTVRNMHLLAPWIGPMALVAREVMIWRDVP